MAKVQVEIKDSMVDEAVRKELKDLKAKVKRLETRNAALERAQKESEVKWRKTREFRQAIFDVFENHFDSEIHDRYEGYWY